MEEIFKKSMQLAAALRKSPSSVPWKPDQPWAQSYHSWSTEKDAWAPIKPPLSLGGGQSSSNGFTSLALYSWNVDLMLPCPETRMNAALAHLQTLADEAMSTATTAVVIHLQECVPADLVTIGQNPWIRDRFFMTDVDDAFWASGAYGTVTLVDRRLEISSCFRIHYSATKMERDGLFIDVVIPSLSGTDKIIRICNTHLESMTPVPPLRPSQMQAIAKQLLAVDETFSGALVAGDFNAIEPHDISLHADNGLKDAYLELGGRENRDEGYTWGQQALRVLRERFGLSRMDKVFFRGLGLQLLSFERFGAEVVVDEATHEDEAGQLLALGFEKPWITDHLGIKAVFSFTSEHHL